MITKYFLNSAKLLKPITLEYTDGVISAILMPFKPPLNMKQYDALLPFIPYYEENIKSVTQAGLYVTKEVGANVKIAMFCTHYLKATGEKYIATKTDGNKIREFRISDELLEHYFRTDHFLFKGKHSISNLTKYYNELVLDMKNGAKGKHPDQWSEAYEAKLKTQQEVNEYWAHLRSLGLTPKKDRLGKTVDWIKAV